MCDKYNGYTNYETWNVKLWIDNDQGEQEYWAEEAQRIYDAETDKDDAANTLSATLKDYFQENKPDVSGTYSDLLQGALDSVNWYEIAENMLEDVDKAEDKEDEETTNEA